MTRGRPRLREEDWKQRGFWRRVEYHNWDERKCWPVVDGFAADIKIRDEDGALRNVRRILWNILVGPGAGGDLDFYDVLLPAGSCEPECINPWHMARTNRSEAGKIRMHKITRGIVTAADRRKAELEYALQKVYGDEALQAQKHAEIVEESVEYRDSYITRRVKVIATGLKPEEPTWDDAIDDALREWVKEKYPKLQDALNYARSERGVPLAPFHEKREIAFRHLLKVYPELVDIIGIDMFAKWKKMDGYGE